MASLLGLGAYGLPMAARLTEVHPSAVRRWFNRRPSDRGRGPVFRADIPIVGQRTAISFLDLIDLLVVGRFRDEGVSLQTIRRVHDRLCRELETRHPFGHQQLLTDGKTVFVKTFGELGDLELEELLSGQRAFPEVLAPYLKQIVYDPQTLLAKRWKPSQGVAIDPQFCLGMPIVDSAGVTTFVIAHSFHANGRNHEVVADLFGITPQQVRNAVEFESRIAA